MKNGFPKGAFATYLRETQSSGQVGRVASYRVERGETPKQIAAKFGRSGAWQTLVLTNKHLGIKPFAKERGTGRVLYTFKSPQEGGGYREGVRLAIPFGWLRGRGVGVGVPGYPCDIGANCSAGESCINGTCAGAPKKQPKQAGASCSTDAECVSGLGCYNGVCAAAFDPCAADEVYVNGVCQKLGAGMPGDWCKSDVDCLNGLGQCVNGVCQHRSAQGGCNPNGAPCGAGYECCWGSECVAGICQKKAAIVVGKKKEGQDCTAALPCEDGLECVAGKCVKLKEPEPVSDTKVWPWLLLGTAIAGLVVGGIWYAGKKDERERAHNPLRPQPSAGYAYVLRGKRWSVANDDKWDTEASPGAGPFSFKGKRHIDGSVMHVWKRGDGRYIAQLEHMTRG